MAAARRLAVPSMDARLVQRVGDWRSPSLLARGAFFVLGAVVGGLTFAVFELINGLGARLATGVTLLAAAEWLIVRKHLFQAGVEEVLWCGGLAAVVAQFVPLSGEIRLTLALALVFALAGVRLLSPLFLTLAAVVVSAAIDLAGGHRQYGEPDVAIAASVFCYSVGAVALLWAGRQLSRPSHDQMLNWLMVIMPLCGFLWLAGQPAVAIRVSTGVVSAVFATVALLLGLRRRAHAPLIACLASLGCVAYQLRDLTALRLEMKLIVWGSAALLLAWALERYLRTPRRGITSRRLSERSSVLDLVQVAGAGTLSPVAAQPSDAAFKGGGGAFSGGGASDGY
jgi:uncharacterized membrane protein YgcG